MSTQSNPEEAKTKALEIAITQLERQYGKGIIMRLGDARLTQGIQCIPTGSLSLDIATGIGGFPLGRIVEIFGQESSGKTTLALHVVANAQKAGGYACYIDAEHALDPTFAQKIGVDIENLHISQPEYAEQAFDICENLVRSNAVDVIVIDSVASLVPKAELEGEIGDQFIALQARLMSQVLRRLTGIISKSKTLVIFINQLRDKPGIMFGNPETTPGGRALKFYASMRVDIRKLSTFKDKDDKERDIGMRVRAKVVKNKLSAPFRSAEFDILFDEGISYEGDVLDLAVNEKIIQKSGTWLSYNGESLGQGRETARKFLKEHPEICKEIRSKILEKCGLLPSQSILEKKSPGQ
ncbi:MAG: recombinase RecA [Candidatus Hydrogenedentes bacterium]|nr:recombinase RecA [Candidatus Hydrogenedentota bacterium]